MQVEPVTAVEFSKPGTYVRPAPHIAPRIRVLTWAVRGLRALAAVALLVLYAGVVVRVGVFALDRLAQFVATLTSVRPG